MPRSKRSGRVADLYAARQAEQMAPDDAEEEQPAPEDEVEVIEAEEPAEDEEDEEAEGDDPADDSDPEAALSVMERQLAAIAAERDELRGRVDEAETTTAITHTAVLKQALGNATREAKAAEAAIAAASAAGNHVEVAKATARLTRAQLDVDKFTLAADEMEAEVTARKTVPKPKQQQSADPYADGIKTFSKPSQEWLMQHRKAIEGNPKAGAKAMALAQLAIADDVEPDSPEFFRRLNEGMGFDVSQKPKPRPKPAPGRKQSSAPAGARGGSSTKNEVALTRAEREAAQQMGMSAAAYAKNKLEIQKNAQDPKRSGLRFSAHAPHIARGR
jgi:hypothetical protein